MTITATITASDVSCQLADLRRRLELVWNAETSASGSFDATNPSAGQCAVTAMIVQDLFGFDLRRSVNMGESHYFNCDPDGREVDLTRDQFPVWAPEETTGRDRAYLESNEATVRRYRILADRLARIS